MNKQELEEKIDNLEYIIALQVEKIHRLEADLESDTKWLLPPLPETECDFNDGRF